MSYCYLIHFEVALRGKQRHYLGFTSNLAQRWGDHQAGHGADLTKLAVRQGVKMTLARVWESGSVALEFELKKRNSFKDHCPVCIMEKAARTLVSHS